MSRADIAYLIIAFMIACGIAGAILSLRFARYRREILRGHRHTKPVWKPFWLP